MKHIDQKFRKAAADIARIIPDVDDPFWNFYRNVTAAEDPTISIPVTFFYEGGAVRTANVRCLASPYQLNLLAIDLAMKSGKKKNLRETWKIVSANNGRPIDFVELSDLLNSDAVVQASAGSPPEITTAFMDFGKAMGEIPCNADRNEMQEKIYNAQATLVSVLSARTHHVEWDGQTSLWQKIAVKFGF